MANGLLCFSLRHLRGDGLVVTPFPAGDPRFAAGTFAAVGALDVRFVFLLLFGRTSPRTANYWIGRHRPRLRDESALVEGSISGAPL
jgi:hypothetical protein